MGVVDIFRKQGGIKLLKQYWQGGALFTGVGEFLLLGKSRTALEILRLSTTLKTKQKLEKEYRRKLDEFDQNYVEGEHCASNKVWVCWFQGIENAPELVKKCYESLQKNLTDKEIVLITKDNIKDFVEFPEEIQRKIDQGLIKGAHLSDLLRLELLIRYGGTWIDSTVYCSGKNIPSYMFDSDLFLFQNLKPGRDGHCTVISNWFITATSNNRILMATRTLLYEYWTKHRELMHYFLFHLFFQIVIERYSDEWNRVIPVSNSTPHVLLLRLFEQYDPVVWEALTNMMPFHKLSYKYDEKEAQKVNTFYERIMRS